MKHVQIFLVLSVFFSLTANAFASNENCWAEFFEHAQYAGEHVRLAGPIQVENLKNINGTDWNARIDSLKVGPKASVIVFDSTNFKLTLNNMANNPDFLRSWGITEKDIREDSELIFGANATVHDLNDFYFRNKIRSLKIDCVK